MPHIINPHRLPEQPSGPAGAIATRYNLFSNVNDWCSRDFDFVGENGREGLISGWFRFRDSGSTTVAMFTGTQTKAANSISGLQRVINGTLILRWFAAFQVNSYVFIIQTGSNVFDSDSGWNHLAISWQEHITVQVYINGKVDNTNILSNAAGNAAYTLPFWQFGAEAAGGLGSPFHYAEMDVSEFIFHDKFFDLSVSSNLEKLYSSDGTATNISTQGYGGADLFSESGGNNELPLIYAPTGNLTENIGSAGDWQSNKNLIPINGPNSPGSTSIYYPGTNSTPTGITWAEGQIDASEIDDLQEFIFSAWIKFEDYPSGNDKYRIFTVAENGASRVNIELNTDGSLTLRVRPSNSLTIVDNIDSANRFQKNNKWYHILLSFDASSTSTNILLFVNDEPWHWGSSNGTESPSASVSQIWRYGSDTGYSFGSYLNSSGVPGGDAFRGWISEAFVSATYLDLSVRNNRRKFITDDLLPADLGTDGSTPLGEAPLFYLPGNSLSNTNSPSGLPSVESTNTILAGQEGPGTRNLEPGRIAKKFGNTKYRAATLGNRNGSLLDIDDFPPTGVKDGLPDGYVSFWMKQKNNPSEIQTILSFGVNSGEEIMTLALNTLGILSLEGHHAASGNNTTRTLAIARDISSFLDNEWHHYFLGWNVTGNTEAARRTLFIDGEAQDVIDSENSTQTEGIGWGSVSSIGYGAEYSGGSNHGDGASFSEVCFVVDNGGSGNFSWKTRMEQFYDADIHYPKNIGPVGNELQDTSIVILYFPTGDPVSNESYTIFHYGMTEVDFDSMDEGTPETVPGPTYDL